MIRTVAKDNDESGTTRTGEQATACDSQQPQRSGDVRVWLLGQSPLRRFLAYVEKECAENVVRASLVDDWRTARDYYRELEHRERGFADQGDHRPIDETLYALAAQVEAEPSYRDAFDTLPTGIEMVELDRLVVHQWQVTHSHAEQVQRRLGPSPDHEAVFRTCLPLEHNRRNIRMERLDSRRYAFHGESEDFGFHEPALLEPEEVCHERFGPVAVILGLVLGFGSNFFSAVRIGDRVILNNGYHRAYALRALGITHAPCAVEKAVNVDELAVAVNPRVAEDAAFYAGASRPPLFKDFFDPRICRSLPSRSLVRRIEVSFEIRESLVPA